MENSPIILIVIAAMFLLVILLRIPSLRNEKKRKQEFDQIAADLGMTVIEKVDGAFRKRLAKLKHFRRNRHARLKNILRENQNDTQVLFFECFPLAATNSSGSSRRVMEGIFHFRSPNLNLPTFALDEAEEIQQLFVNALGYKDINFESHPEFSKKYLLNADDEQAARELFDDRLLSFLEKLRGISIEGAGDQLIVYRPAVRISPHQFSSLKQEAVHIFKQFRR